MNNGADERLRCLLKYIGPILRTVSRDVPDNVGIAL